MITNTDFTGFSFDGIHSSQLNILRVSGGDRYGEELTPPIKDYTVEIPGLNGEYYFGSNFEPREIEIEIAFDSMTEKQFRQMRRLFGTKKVCELIFDERPYKVYLAKIKDPIELEYVCFDERKKTIAEARNGVRVATRTAAVDDQTGETTYTIEREQVTPYIYSDETERIYKGEGKIEFICYFPFAKQLFKQLDLYEQNGNTFTNFSNVDEWKESSRLLTTEQFNNYNIDRLVRTTNGSFNYKIPVYNPGDMPTGFFLYIPFRQGCIVPKNGNYVEIFGDENGLLLKPIYMPSGLSDTGILINTNNHLIQGVSNFNPLINNVNDRRAMWWTLSGTLYNEYIAAGDFPRIKQVDWYFDNEQFSQAIYLNCLLKDDNNTVNVENNVAIRYDYLYF